MDCPLYHPCEAATPRRSDSHTALSSVFVALNLIPAHVPRLYPSRRDRDVAKKEDHVGIN